MAVQQRSPLGIAEGRGLLSRADNISHQDREENPLAWRVFSVPGQELLYLANYAILIPVPGQVISTRDNPQGRIRDEIGYIAGLISRPPGIIGVGQALP